MQMLSKRKQKKLESIRRRISLLTAKIEHAEAERASLQCEAVRLCVEKLLDADGQEVSIPVDLFGGLRPTNEVARVPVGDGR